MENPIKMDDNHVEVTNSWCLPLLIANSQTRQRWRGGQPPGEPPEYQMTMVTQNMVLRSHKIYHVLRLTILFSGWCVYIYIIGIHMFEPFLYHINIYRLTSTLLYWHADWTLCKGADTLSCFTLDGLALWFLWCWALQRFYCVPPPQSRSNSSALYLQYTMVI